MLLCESIARRVFPRESCPEYEGIEEVYYAYRIRDRLRKEVLVPLRKALELPEVYIGANQWNALLYNRVASVAMKTYKPLFVKHDGERFREYLFSVEKGEAKIAAGALLPLEIIAELERIVHRKEMQRFNDMLSYDGSDDYNNDDEERQKQKEKIEEKEEDDAELKVLELQRK